MDDADRAEINIERATEAAVAAVTRAARPRFSLECRDCGIDLPPHRQEFGTCIDCQTAREKRSRAMATGV